MPGFAYAALWFFIVILAVFQILAVVGAPVLDLLEFDSFFISLVIIGLAYVLLFRRIRFFVTNRRIVKTVDMFVWRRTLQLPLQSLTGAIAGRKQKRPRYRYVVFGPPAGYVPIVFGPVKDDPERVREIALRARASVTGTPAQTFLQTSRTMRKDVLTLLVAGIVLAFAGGAIPIVRVAASATVNELIQVIVSVIALSLFFGGVELVVSGAVIVWRAHKISRAKSNDPLDPIL
jgi:hypothetical protein